MDSMDINLTFYERELGNHRAWLGAAGPRRVERWELLLRNDWEAAIVEALAREFLQSEVPGTRPFDDPESGGPDLVCHHPEGHFYVEVTCLRESTVTSQTGLLPYGGEGGFYFTLTLSILRKCINKARQCGKLDAPCLLLIGTLHREGAEVCFNRFHVEDVLLGEGMITAPFDPEVGETGDIRETRNVEKAAFIKGDAGKGNLFGPARRSISGLLLCGFSRRKPDVLGVLHPCPARAFDPSLLPNVTFGRVVETAGGSKQVEWR